MSKEQNIDDILQLLRDSYSSESHEESIESIEASEQNISTEALQEQLKNQYISAIDSYEAEKPDNSDSYFIDTDFLTEAALAKELEIPEAVETDEFFEVVDSYDNASVILEDIESQSINEFEYLQRTLSEASEDEEEFEEYEEALPEDNVDELIAAMSPIPEEEFYSNELLDKEDEANEFFAEIFFGNFL